MKYKILYEDPSHKLHVRYYNALDAKTAKEMFAATVSHSIKEEVKLVNVERLEDRHWVEIKKN